ncbi:MAG: hypothetical protein Q7W55_10385 [Pseudohongiella sp.]|nr:hypothetical protein [Pseudohongiella sp.]
MSVESAGSRAMSMIKPLFFCILTTLILVVSSHVLDIDPALTVAICALFNVIRIDMDRRADRRQRRGLKYEL